MLLFHLLKAFKNESLILSNYLAIYYFVTQSEVRFSYKLFYFSKVENLIVDGIGQRAEIEARVFGSFQKRARESERDREGLG